MLDRSNLSKESVLWLVVQGYNPSQQGTTQEHEAAGHIVRKQNMVDAVAQLPFCLLLSWGT